MLPAHSAGTPTLPTSGSAGLSRAARTVSEPCSGSSSSAPNRSNGRLAPARSSVQRVSATLPMTTAGCGRSSPCISSRSFRSDPVPRSSVAAAAALSSRPTCSSADLTRLDPRLLRGHAEAVETRTRRSTHTASPVSKRGTFEPRIIRLTRALSVSSVPALAAPRTTPRGTALQLWRCRSSSSTPHSRSTSRYFTSLIGRIRAMARSANARIDSAGLTPRLAGITEPSQT